MNEIELGSHVKVIIDNPGFNITFNIVRQHYRDAWASTKPEQKEIRETLYNTSVALEDVYRQFLSLAVAGDNAVYTEEKNKEK